MDVLATERVTNWLGQLQKSGYRLTAPRRAVVNTLACSQRALNAYEVHEAALKEYPKLGLVSVYRTLEKLNELDLIQRVHHPDGCQAYIAGFTGHQHLLICQKCGHTEYFEGDNLKALVNRVSGESGYRIDEHWLQLFGVCPNCRKSD